jgi:hypothetical protein
MEGAQSKSRRKRPGGVWLNPRVAVTVPMVGASNENLYAPDRPCKPGAKKALKSSITPGELIPPA